MDLAARLLQRLPRCHGYCNHVDACAALTAAALGPLWGALPAADVDAVSAGLAFGACLRLHDSRHHGTVLQDAYLAHGAGFDQPLCGPAERLAESAMQVKLELVVAGGIGHCGGSQKGECRLLGGFDPE
jgi:hypothetical protein